MCLSSNQPLWKPSFLTTESFGLALMLISAVLFSTMGMFLKMATNKGNLSSTQLVFIRAIFQGSVTVALMAREGGYLLQRPLGDDPSVRRVVLLRGLFGGFGVLFYFYSMRSLHLGDAVTLFSLYPIITLFLARSFLKERIGWGHVLAAASSTMGAVLIVGPFRGHGGNDENGPNYDPLGYVTAVAGSFCASAVVVLVRKAGVVGSGNCHTLCLLFSWSAFTTCLGLVVGNVPFIQRDVLGERPWRWSFDENTASYVLAVCVFGTAGHFLMNHGGKMAPATLGSIARASDILWAYGWQTIFFQTPRFSTVMGVLLVLFSLCLVAVTRTKKQEAGVDVSNKEGDDNQPMLNHQYEEEGKDMRSYGTIPTRIT